MSANNLAEAFRLLESMEDGDFVGRRDASLVEKAENALGIKFPPTYRKFVETYGCGDVAGQEFYGLFNEGFQHSGVPDSVWLTLVERGSGLPHNLVLIASTGDGGYYALDASQIDERGEYPVVIYEVDGTIWPEAADFGSFLLSQLKTAI